MISEMAERYAMQLASTTGNIAHKDLYRYGIECTLNELLTDLLLIVIGFLMHRIPEIIVWDVTFTICRINMGGWHASSHLRCILSSCATGFFSIFLIHFFVYFNHQRLFIALLFSTCIIIWKFLPLSTPNHLVTSLQKKKSKTISFSMVLLGILFIIFFPSNTVIMAYIIGIIAAVLLAIIQILSVS